MAGRCNKMGENKGKGGGDAASCNDKKQGEKDKEAAKHKPCGRIQPDAKRKSQDNICDVTCDTKKDKEKKEKEKKESKQKCVDPKPRSDKGKSSGGQAISHDDFKQKNTLCADRKDKKKKSGTITCEDFKRPNPLCAKKIAAKKEAGEVKSKQEKGPSKTSKTVGGKITGIASSSQSVMGRASGFIAMVQALITRIAVRIKGMLGMKGGSKPGKKKFSVVKPEKEISHHVPQDSVCKRPYEELKPCGKSKLPDASELKKKLAAETSSGKDLKSKLPDPSGQMQSLKKKLPDPSVVQRQLQEAAMQRIQRLKKLDWSKMLKNRDITPIFGSLAGSSMSEGGPARPMKYPYTFSAKIAQFPFMFYLKNQWIWKYYAVSFAVCIPIFYKINKLANSPGNVAKWAEIRRKEAMEHHH